MLIPGGRRGLEQQSGICVAVANMPSVEHGEIVPERLRRVAVRPVGHHIVQSSWPRGSLGRRPFVIELAVRFLLAHNPVLGIAFLWGCGINSQSVKQTHRTLSTSKPR